MSTSIDMRSITRTWPIPCDGCFPHSRRWPRWDSPMRTTSSSRRRTRQNNDERWVTTALLKKLAAVAWGSSTKPNSSRSAAVLRQDTSVCRRPGSPPIGPIQERGVCRCPVAPHEHRSRLWHRLRARRLLLRDAVDRGPDAGGHDSPIASNRAFDQTGNEKASTGKMLGSNQRPIGQIRSATDGR